MRQLPQDGSFNRLRHHSQRDVLARQWDDGAGKAANHPRQTITWYDMVK